jgi:hypothetical protein
MTDYKVYDSNKDQIVGLFRHHYTYTNEIQLDLETISNPVVFRHLTNMYFIGQNLDGVLFTGRLGRNISSNDSGDLYIDGHPYKIYTPDVVTTLPDYFLIAALDACKLHVVDSDFNIVAGSCEGYYGLFDKFIDDLPKVTDFTNNYDYFWLNQPNLSY